MDIHTFTAELGAFIALQLEGKASPTQDEPVAGPPSFPGTSHWLWTLHVLLDATASGWPPAICTELGPGHRHSLPPYLRWRREGRGPANAVSGPALETELTGAKLPLQISAVTHLAPLQGSQLKGR